MRARSYEPTVARWTSIDPLLWIAYVFAENAPVLAVDPSGFITITQVSNAKVLGCGGYSGTGKDGLIEYKYQLDKTYTKIGPMIQMVTIMEAILPCPKDIKSCGECLQQLPLPPPKTTVFWEWFGELIDPGKTTGSNTVLTGRTDGAKDKSHPNTCGYTSVFAFVKFFFGPEIVRVGDNPQNWRRGGNPSSGSLPSTNSKPPWWDKFGKESGSRQIITIWCCCPCKDEFSYYFFNPQGPGTTPSS